MNEIIREELIRFKEVVRLLPSHPHLSTLHRWRMRGVRGVRLDALLLGGVWFTSHAALTRFIVAVTAAATNNNAVRSIAPERRDDERQIECDLDAAGL